MKKFDREALSDCFDSFSLASEIRRQFKLGKEAAPLLDIASQVGIWNIREQKLGAIDGALVVPDGKIEGEILLHADLYPERKRFTLAHEIGHFVHPFHHPELGKFECNKNDMYLQTAKNNTELMEVQANKFASELLLPSVFVRECFPSIDKIDLDTLVDLSELFEISKAAAARKVFDIYKGQVAFIFSLNGVVNYLLADNFPYIKTWYKRPLPVGCATLSHSGEDNSVSKTFFPNRNIWLSGAISKDLYEQVLIQENGFRITLLRLF